MERFGVTVQRNGWSSFVIPAGSRYRSPGTIHVEGDASGASYFLAAGAIGGGPVRVEGVGRASIQGDIRFADALRQMGARVELGENWVEARGPATGRLRAFDLDLNHIRRRYVAVAVFDVRKLRNIASWRDRQISAMATSCAKSGQRWRKGRIFW
jgi:3-phosphoshikimate 1-carboxyvinyltransferase